jgi:hypothetical protein
MKGCHTVMQTLSERLDNIRVRVKVPGVDIHAEIHHRDQVTLSFGPDVYAWVSEQDLARHMTTLARLLFVGWNRAYRAALTDEFRAHALSGPVNDTDRQYLAARAELAASGVSSDGRIKILSKGLQGIRIGISRGTTRALTEQVFAERTREAVMDLARDHMDKIYELKMRFYG